MENLGLMDQLFYKADQYQVASMVMGGVSVLEPASPKGRLNARELADHMAARLEKIPLMRQKFVQDPLRLGSVRKVEDPEFDISEHILLDSLSAPGGYRELTAAISEISARPLTLTELWRWTILDGLEGGRVAVMCQMHHALFDGLGALQALGSIYDPKPVAAEKPSADYDSAQSEKGAYALLTDAIRESSRRLLITTPRFWINNTVPMLNAASGGLANILRDGPGRLAMPEASSTSLNINQWSPNRSLAYRTMSLARIKRLSKYFQVTVNDIALSIFSHALDHYFESIGEEVDFDLWSAMPVSTRTDDGKGGNQIVTALMNLHNSIVDPQERLDAISSDTRQAKQAARPEEGSFDVGAMGELVPPLLMDGLLFLAGKLNLMGKMGNSVTVFNALLSNVPGPQQPMYVANARPVESIPLIPPLDIIALSAGITSVGDSLTLGFLCDSEHVVDPELFGEGAELGLALLESVKASAKSPPGRKKVKKASG